MTCSLHMLAPSQDAERPSYLPNPKRDSPQTASHMGCHPFSLIKYQALCRVQVHRNVRCSCAHLLDDIAVDDLLDLLNDLNRHLANDFDWDGDHLGDFLDHLWKERHRALIEGCMGFDVGTSGDSHRGHDVVSSGGICLSPRSYGGEHECSRCSRSQRWEVGLVDDAGGMEHVPACHHAEIQPDHPLCSLLVYCSAPMALKAARRLIVGQRARVQGSTMEKRLPALLAAPLAASAPAASANPERPAPRG
eukprot:scaffold178110_cov41-Tisochrysis_lutea.AAC.5